MVNYFFDTYAIIELLKHNPDYAPYKDCGFATTILNKIELHSWAVNAYGDAFGEILLAIPTHDITNDVIRNATAFRLKHKRRNISYADAIGYAFARVHELTFLTGDKAFTDIPHVKHVPKRA